MDGSLLAELGRFSLAAAVIVASGIGLSKFADALSDHLKLGKMLAGIILMAAATSLPELSVSVSAVKQGAPDMAVSGLFGSNLFNLLVLGIIDLSSRSRGQMFSRVSASHALSGCMGIALIVLPAFAIAGKFPQSFLNLGVGSWGILITYAFATRLVFHDQTYLRSLPSEAKGEKVGRPQGSLLKCLLGYVATAACIFLAAPHLSASATELTSLTGLKQTFIGTSLLALATSLPELVTTAAAVRLGSIEMAVGNIFGSNSFNMVIVAAADLFYPGALLAVVSDTNLVTCLATIFITSIIIMGQVYHAERRIALVEPDALLVIILALSTLGIVFYLG